MRIKRADKAGFCFGVKRAIEMAEMAAAKGNTASLGPLIHNQQVVDYLKRKGIEVKDSIDELSTGQQLVIRSHGVPPGIYEEAERKNIPIIDATCPYVQKAQKLAAGSAKDCYIIVVGDKNHPEVKGILGWAGCNSQAVENVQEARNLGFYPRIAVLAQTTLPQDIFSDVVNELNQHTDDLIVHNTICKTTGERQASACKLSENVDVMVVVGGKSSSNTRKLGAICSQKTNTYLIETADELQQIWFKNADSVGLTAGASTPDWIIEEVYTRMSEIMDKTNEVVQELVDTDNSVAGTETDTCVEKPAENTAEEQTAEDNDKTEEENLKENEKAEEENSMDSVINETNSTLNEAADNTTIEISEEENSMDNFDSELPRIYNGAVIKGKVVKITNDEVYVDISWKSEGIIPIEELSSTKVIDINDIVRIGDNIKVMVTRVENNEGYTVLSRRRASEIEARERLAKLAETKEEVQAKATEAVKGGLLVDLGMRGFIPASQVDLGYVEDLNKYVGETLRLRVIEFDPGRRKLVLSQKAILAEEYKTKREKLLQDLQEGDIVKGTVRRLTSFGAFIDLGGIDGLLHVSDMAFSRINHPSEIVSIGDEVDVQVLAKDAEKNRISLGLKQLRPNPWTNIEERYPAGSTIQGKVVRIAQFGAFIQLEDGVDALVHISQLADYRVNKVEDVVKAGDMITAKVVECKQDEKRISLSIREVIEEARKEEDKEVIEKQADVPEVTIGDAVGEIQPDYENEE